MTLLPYLPAPSSIPEGNENKVVSAAHDDISTSMESSF